jgi:S1-C subfamily serine protease
MAPRFLGKTPLDDLEPIEINGRPVLADYARLRDLLETRAPPAAGLFAEPVGNWNTGDARVVSWYAEAGNEPEIFASISADRRQQLEAYLRTVMAALAPLLSDPVIGQVLRSALVLATSDGIKAVDGRIVLTDWGLVRAGTMIPADPLTLSPLAAYLAAAGPSTPRPRVAPPPPPSRPIPAPVPVGVMPAARSVWNWWLVPLGIAVAVAFLIFGLWLGARLVAERVAQQPTTVTLFDEAAVRAALERQKEQNAALERELEERRRALSANVCTADPSQMPRTGPDHAAVVPPAATPTPPGGAPFHGNLADLLTQSVVLVIGAQQDGVETGSGFFVAPDMIVTNRHVVEHALPGKLIVTGGKLGHATRAEVVAESPTAEIGALDVALLRIPAVPDVQPLAMSPVAAAYPGLTMRGDEAYGRLLNGDMTAMPTVILTDGKISAIQTSSSGLKIMPHTAAVSGGNSGGPLVDACGRVVGVNTFITADREQVAHNNYAQKSDAIIAFLEANGVHVQVVNDPCVPTAASASPAAPAPATGAPSAAPAAPAPAPAGPPAIPPQAAPPARSSPG